MELEVRKYERFHARVMWLLGVSGLNSYFHPILKRLLSVVAFVSLFSVSTSIVNFCFHTTDISLLCKGIGQSISWSASFFRFVIFLVHYEDMEFLNKGLITQFASDLRSLTNRPYLLQHISGFVNLFQMYNIMTGATLFLFMLRPVLVYVLHHKCIRPFQTRYPLEYEPEDFGHWLLLNLESVGSFYAYACIQGVDSAFGLYSLQICGQFRILASRFKELHVNIDYVERIRECIKRHHLLLHSKNRLQNLYGLIAIMLTVSAGLVICTLAFQLSEGLKHGAGIMQILAITVYLLPKLIQIFIYSYYGDALAEESKACLEAMYNSRWPISCDSRFKKDMLIVLAQRPLILTAKGCMYIQLDMFSKVINTSVSYFFLLQTLSEKQN